MREVDESFNDKWSENDTEWFMKNSVTISTGKEEENIRAMGKIFAVKWRLIDVGT